jgi:hypothetical protein
MMNYINYEEGETGLNFTVYYDKSCGSIELISVCLNDADILPLLSEEVILNIQLYVDNYLGIS